MVHKAIGFCKKGVKSILLGVKYSLNEYLQYKTANDYGVKIISKY